MKTSRRSILLMTAALVLLAIAAALNYKQEHLGGRAYVCNAINEFGYDFQYTDIYISGSSDDVSIRHLMEGVDLQDAVEASKKAGFEADIDGVGNATVFLAAIDDQRVITVYTLDQTIQLAFIQRLNSYEVESLCQESE